MVDPYLVSVSHDVGDSTEVGFVGRDLDKRTTLE